MSVVLETKYDDHMASSDTDLSMGCRLTREHINDGLSHLGPSANGFQFTYLNFSAQDLNLRDITLLSKYRVLQRVDVSGNYLSDLSALNSMRDLLVINASHNCLKSIPDINPISLLDMDFSFNNITHIDDLSKHKYLQKLNLNNNSINKITGISECQYLSEICLAFNNIEKIKGLPSELHFLRILDLQHNKITVIENLCRLQSLREINLSDNQIKTLQGLEYCSTLETVLVENNQIENLDDIVAIRELSLLRVLNLDRNPIQEVEDYRLSVIFEIPHLSILDKERCTVEEKVLAVNMYDPPLEITAATDHMTHVLFSGLQNQTLRKSTTTSIHTPHPVIVIVSPASSQRDVFLYNLSRDLRDYVSVGVLHTTRPEPDNNNYVHAVHVTNAVFDSLLQSGLFACTYTELGFDYGLSLDSIEHSAIEHKACITAMPLLGVLSLQKTHYQPHCILAMPLDANTHKAILKASDFLTPEAQWNTFMERVEYLNRGETGVFQSVIDTSDVTKSYNQIKGSIAKFLGINLHSTRHSVPDTKSDGDTFHYNEECYRCVELLHPELHQHRTASASSEITPIEQEASSAKYKAIHNMLTTLPIHTTRDTCSVGRTTSKQVYNKTDSEALPPDSPFSTLDKQSSFSSVDCSDIFSPSSVFSGARNISFRKCIHEGGDTKVSETEPRSWNASNREASYMFSKLFRKPRSLSLPPLMHSYINKEEF